MSEVIHAGNCQQLCVGQAGRQGAAAGSMEDDLVLLSGHRWPGLVTGGSMEGPGGLRVAAVRTLKVGVWDVWACQQQQMLCCSAHSIQSVAC